MTPNPKVAEHIRAAMAAMKRADFAAAEEACSDALALDPENLHLQNRMAHIAHLRGDTEKGLRIISRILKENSAFPEALFLKGKIFFDLGRLGEARESLEKAVQNWPANDFRAFALLGRVFLHLRQYANAVGWLEKALAIKPGVLAAQNDLGLALKNSQRPEKAVAVFEKAISKAPDNPVFLFNLALVRLDLKARDEAEALLRRAIDLKPDYLEAHEALSELLGQTHEDFVGAYPEAIRKAPENLALRLQYVDALLRTGRSEKGREVLADLEKDFGKTPGGLSRLAKIRITRDDKEKALEHLEEAARLDPASIPLKLEAGKLLIRMGEYERALSHLEAGLADTEFHQELIAYQVLCWRLKGDERARAMLDYGAFVFPALIGTPPGYASLADFNAALLEKLDAFHSAQIEPLGQSLRGGTQTLTSLFSMEVREIQEAKKAISEKVREFIAGLPDDPDHPFLKRKTGDFRFSGSWSIRLRDQGFHVNHVHPEGWISSSYYVQVPPEVENGSDNKGCLKLGESPLKLGEREEVGKIVRPRPGLMVVFPSYMFHGTFPFTSGEKRTTMPFDIVPA